VKYNTFVTFLTVLIFSILSTGQTAAELHTLNSANDVFPHKKVLLGVKMTGDGIWGNMPHKPLGNFKPKRQNLSQYLSQITADCDAICTK